MNGAAQLTYLALGLAVFGQQLCLPLPSMLLLMTVGALAARGEGHLTIPLVLLTSVFACVAADSVWFWLGRRWGSNVIRMICSLTSNPQGSRERSRHMFDRWGLRLLLVAKFIPLLDGVSPPLAGAQGATVQGFLAYDSVGSLLWSAVYLLAGFLFSTQLDRVIRLLDRFGSGLLLLIGIPMLLWAAWRLLRIVKMIRHLRLHRISPAMLQRMIDDGDRIGVVDLLRYEAMDQELAGIPGSVRADPEQLRKSQRVVVPEGVSMVLYCSSKNEFTSARVAQAMKKLGVSNVWILEGGLDAWVAEGRPTTTTFSTREEMAERLGVVIQPPGQHRR
ncbi:membrane protein DedA, SNARE-associated domain [Granulicella pectinivorans]|uniref:Membrane protein DedA, SNARE-associated domain n=2 Tax=Granulicella pectinivorans TaxID=474950 RepID=A0A1I6M966_9BACT|nr:membrane protein DedA, SNARE-associated domain [Granulicella pectinivorans]